MIAAASVGDVLFTVGFVGLFVGGAAFAVRDLAKKNQRYKLLVAAIAAHPETWVTVLSNRPGPVRPTGPALHCLGVGPNPKNAVNSIVAFDDEYLVVRSLAKHPDVLVMDRGWPPARYFRKSFLQVERLLFGGKVVTGPSAYTLTAQLTSLGWPVIDAPYGMHAVPLPTSGWRRPRPAPPSPAPTPVGPAQPIARPNPPNTPVRPAVSPTATDIEYGTDHLGPAIDDWIDHDDLEEIE